MMGLGYDDKFEQMKRLKKESSMTPEVLNMIAQFMSRVDLKATEIDAYQTCMQCLQEEFQRLQPQEEPQDGPDSTDT